MKTKVNKSEPIIVTIPSTIEVKMRAILAIAESIKEVSKALNSVNVQVKMENIYIDNCETGILIEGEL